MQCEWKLMKTDCIAVLNGLLSNKRSKRNRKKWEKKKRKWKKNWSNRQPTNGKGRIPNTHSMEFQFLRPIVRCNKSVGLTLPQMPCAGWKNSVEFTTSIRRVDYRKNVRQIKKREQNWNECANWIQYKVSL